MNLEVLLAAGYALALIAGAFLLEWLSAHTHRRSLRFRTAGFDYDPATDSWVCPEGEALWPHEFDRERRIVRYRAKPQICNACHRKHACTDSDRGREITRPLDPWPHSEAGRFHRTLSAVMVVLGLLIVAIEVARHHQASEVAVLGIVALAGLASLRWLLRDLRRHPANFPAPRPAHGLGFAAAGADGVRERTRWASQKGERPTAEGPGEPYSALDLVAELDHAGLEGRRARQLHGTAGKPAVKQGLARPQHDRDDGQQ